MVTDEGDGDLTGFVAIKVGLDDGALQVAERVVPQADWRRQSRDRRPRRIAARKRSSPGC